MAKPALRDHEALRIEEIVNSGPDDVEETVREIGAISRQIDFAWRMHNQEKVAKKPQEENVAWAEYEKSMPDNADTAYQEYEAEMLPDKADEKDSVWADYQAAQEVTPDEKLVLNAMNEISDLVSKLINRYIVHLPKEEATDVVA